MPGCAYRPGMELCLGAALLEDWALRGFVKLIEPQPVPEKPKRKRKRVKRNTAVTA